MTRPRHDRLALCDQRLAAPTRDVPEPRSPAATGALLPATVVALQRTAGNCAVSAFLERGPGARRGSLLRMIDVDPSIVGPGKAQLSELVDAFTAAAIGAGGEVGDMVQQLRASPTSHVVLKL